MNRGNFFTELKRRNVYRVAVAYAAIGWLVIQVVTSTFPVLEIPAWAVRLVVILVLLGFPVALVLAWGFEMTPQGVKRTADIPPGATIPHWSGRKFAMLIVGAALGAAGLLGLQLLGPKRFGIRAEARVVEKSIAVLPFANLSGDPDNAFFADGMQDQILTNLAQIAELKVISRTSVLQYKTGAPRNLREIGQQLGVVYLLEGSVQRANSKIRLIAQLIDARTDAHLWAQTYDRDLEDTFVIQSEIAQSIADQLQARLSPNEKKAIEQALTNDLAAFELYSRAKNLLLAAGAYSGTMEKNLPQAIELANQAVARDPSFFHAYCLLAYLHDRTYFMDFDRTPDRLSRAEAALDAAARLRPDAGETHLARAIHRYHGYLDYNGALAELEIARRTLPNEARVYEYFGYVARRQGKFEESLHYLERALELDPRNFLTLTQTALSYGQMRRYPDVAAILDRALAIYPDNVEAQLSRALVDLNWKADTRPYHNVLQKRLEKDPAAVKDNAEDLFALALYERDVPAAEVALAAKGDEPLRANAFVYTAKANAGFLARMAGDQEKARAAFTVARDEQEKVVQAQPNSGPRLAQLALYEAALGQKEEALRDGRRAMELLPPEKDALNGPRVITMFAMIAAWAGEKDIAFEHLNRAVKLATGPSYGDLKLDPNWDPLRDDPRFAKILDSLGPK
jgi:TolB-like protein/Tfp pilus assembly protein PilF